MTPAARMKAEAAEAQAVQRAVAARELARHRQARKWLTHVQAGLDRNDPIGWKIAKRGLFEAVALLTIEEREALFWKMCRG